MDQGATWETQHKRTFVSRGFLKGAWGQDVNFRSTPVLAIVISVVSLLSGRTCDDQQRFFSSMRSQ